MVTSMLRKKKGQPKPRAAWPKASRKLPLGPEFGASVSHPIRDQWNVPDWTDKNAYPDFRRTSPQEWAWEFYRRSDNARLSYSLNSKWDPRGAMPEDWRYSVDYRPTIVVGPGATKIGDRMAAIVVRLDVPLEEQLERAVREISETLPYSRIAKLSVQYPVRHQEFKDYLRILDARHAGASLKDIKAALGFEAKKTRTYLQVATTWANLNWIYLLIKKPGRKSRNRDKAG